MTTLCHECDRQTIEARTGRSNLPVFYTGFWHVLMGLFGTPAKRLQRLRSVGSRMLEDALSSQDDCR